LNENASAWAYFSYLLKKKQMINKLLFDTYALKRNFKFLVEVNFDSVSFEISPKLNMLLNQFGVYESDKLAPVLDKSLIKLNWFSNINIDKNFLYDDSELISDEEEFLLEDENLSEFVLDFYLAEKLEDVLKNVIFEEVLDDLDILDQNSIWDFFEVKIFLSNEIISIYDSDIIAEEFSKEFYKKIYFGEDVEDFDLILENKQDDTTDEDNAAADVNALGDELENSDVDLAADESDGALFNSDEEDDSDFDNYNTTDDAFIESDAFSELEFLVPFWMIFSQKKKKTFIYVLNPLTNKLFTNILILNLLKNYLIEKNKRSLFLFRQFSYLENMQIRSLKLISARMQKIDLKKLKHANSLWRTKQKIIKLWSPGIFNIKKYVKKKKYIRRIKKFYKLKKLKFILKKFNWFSVFLLFKLIIFKVLFLTITNYFYKELKLFFYSLKNILRTYKSLILKKYKKFKFKKKKRKRRLKLFLTLKNVS
jgi:hypothetical protein